MNRTGLVVAALCAGLVAGCASDDGKLTQTQVERRVSTLVGDNEGGAAEAKCVKLSEAPDYRCEVSVNGVGSTYEARVKMRGEKIELKKR